MRNFRATTIRLAAAAAAVAAIAAAPAAAPGAASAATRQPAVAAIAHQPAVPAAAQGGFFHHAIVVVDCHNHFRVMPHAFVLTCADGNDFLAPLAWVTWGATAFGAGLEHINDCTPDCAHGTFHSFRVLVVLWRPRLLGIPHWHWHWHILHFTRLTVIYTHGRPNGSATKTVTLWSHI